MRPYLQQITVTPENMTMVFMRQDEKGYRHRGTNNMHFEHHESSQSIVAKLRELADRIERYETKT